MDSAENIHAVTDASATDIPAATDWPAEAAKTPEAPTVKNLDGGSGAGDAAAQAASRDTSTKWEESTRNGAGARNADEVRDDSLAQNGNWLVSKERAGEAETESVELQEVMAV